MVCRAAARNAPSAFAFTIKHFALDTRRYLRRLAGRIRSSVEAGHRRVVGWAGNLAAAIGPRRPESIGAPYCARGLPLSALANNGHAGFGGDAYRRTLDPSIELFRRHTVGWWRQPHCATKRLHWKGPLRSWRKLWRSNLSLPVPPLPGLAALFPALPG